jgi:hypothetical protein
VRTVQERHGNGEASRDEICLAGVQTTPPADHRMTSPSHPKQVEVDGVEVTVPRSSRAAMPLQARSRLVISTCPAGQPPG